MVYDMAFTSDSQLLVSRDKRDVLVWDLATGGLCRTIIEKDRIGHYPTVALSSNSELAFLEDRGGDTIRLLHLTTGKLSRTFQGHKFEVRAVMFSPNSKLLVTIDHFESVRIWNVVTCELRHVLNPPKDDADNHEYHIVFSSDGRLLACVFTRSFRDTEVMLWNPLSGEVLSTIRIPSYIKTATFSPDGKLFASADRDGVVQLWNPATRKLYRQFSGGDHPIEAIAFVAEDQLLAGSDAQRN